MSWSREKQLGMTWQALHTWIWGFSAIPLCGSSKALSGWTGTVSGQTLGLSIEFNWDHIRALVQPLKDMHSCPLTTPVFLGCELRVIVLLEAEPSAQSKVLSSGSGFHWRFLCALLCSTFPQSWPISLSLPWKTPHSMMMPAPCVSAGWYWAGDECCLVSFRYDTYNWDQTVHSWFYQTRESFLKV